MAKKPKTIDLFVPGHPSPAGSKSYRGTSKAGKAIIVDSAKRSRPWKDTIIAAFLEQREEQGWTIFDQGLALFMAMEFYMPRPKGHYSTGANAGVLKPRFESARPVTKPDVLKLARCVEDALTGFAYHDDAQIVTESMMKRYARPEHHVDPGVRITVRPL
jgi:Holliday junction resolvase RusA-like endonuclease